MNMEQVSVVIPCYNGARYLSEAIDSVLAQTYPVSEIVVVDDGSTDHTGDVCSRYAQVHYIYQTNQGVSKARNAGIQASQGEYLVFLDCDDRLLPQAVEIGVNRLRTHPEAGFVFGFYRSIQADGSLIPHPAPTLPATASYETLLDCTHLIPPAGAMVRRSVIESIGGFNPVLRRGEDYDFWLRIARTFPIYFHNQPVFEYRRHEDNASSHAAEMLRDELQALKLQWAYIQQANNSSYQAAYQRGRRFWITLFGPVLPYQMLNHLKARQWLPALHVLLLSLRYYPQGLGQLGGTLLRKVVPRS